MSCEAQHIQKELIRLKGTDRKGADRKTSASRRVSTSCTPLSDGGVAAAASARRASWIGLTHQLSEANLDQVGQPRVLTRLGAGDPTARHGSTVMVEQTGSVKIAAGEVSSGGLWLGPNTVHLLRWCLLLAVGITVLAFPFLLSFEGPVSGSRNRAWFAVLLACDVVLWLDVASRFVTPQWEGGDEGEETRLSHRRVASRYLHSWDGLLLDVLCRWPWDAFVAAAAGVHIALYARCTTTCPPTVTFAPFTPLVPTLAPRPSPT